MMNQRMTLQQVFPILLALLLVAAALLALNLDSAPAIQLGSDILGGEAAVDVEAFDYERAADISALRWQAMAEAYERAGLLNDRIEPGDASAYRWQAMARAYEQAGLLIDRLDPGDVAAFRWQAMAEAYERAGLLNDK